MCYAISVLEMVNANTQVVHVGYGSNVSDDEYVGYV